MHVVLHYMNGDSLSTIIKVDYTTKKVEIENFTDDNIARAFGVNLHPTMQDFEEFLEDRCFPREGFDMKRRLKDFDIDFYDPRLIIEKTQGRVYGDDMWIDVKEGVL